jgi:hypothetical protein
MTASGSARRVLARRRRHEARDHRRIGLLGHADAFSRAHGLCGAISPGSRSPDARSSAERTACVPRLKVAADAPRSAASSCRRTCGRARARRPRATSTCCGTRVAARRWAPVSEAPGGCLARTRSTRDLRRHGGAGRRPGLTLTWQRKVFMRLHWIVGSQLSLSTCAVEVCEGHQPAPRLVGGGPGGPGGPQWEPLETRGLARA